MSLSVIVITRDESHCIRACLQSVAWADEIIVVDSGSTDDTVAICQEFTAKVYIMPDWPGFGRQKNRALDFATGDWVLAVDADEQVSDALRQAIAAAMVSARYAAWKMPRKSWYCGKFMRHGGWWPDYVTRLFQRDAARFSDDVVHERLIVADGHNVGTLAEPLIHYSFLTLEEVVAKMNHYSSAGAAQRLAQGQTGGLTKAVLAGLWTFIRTYFLRLGLLDGKQGFMLAVSNAESTYYRYLKLMLLADAQEDK